MTEEEIIEGKFLIANFMGFNYKSIDNPVFDANLYDLHDYDDSWNTIIPACKKFCIEIRDKMFEMEEPIYDKYIEHCKNIETINFEIADTFKNLVNAIQWYNSQTK